METKTPILDAKVAKSLLLHERDLLLSGALCNETHPNASAVWLHGASGIPLAGQTNVYRPVGDVELQYLFTHNKLPGTQPYQAIIEGTAGRAYAEKYLSGAKWVNTAPTTVVEFSVPITLVAELFKLQHKAEDGAVSMGLGHKAGGGLGLFNASISVSKTWRIVKVKRPMRVKGAKSTEPVKVKGKGGKGRGPKK